MFDFLLSLLHLYAATHCVQSCFLQWEVSPSSSLIHCFSYSLVEAVPYLWFSAQNDSTKVIWKFMGYTQANSQASSHNYQITNSGIQTHVFNSLLKKAAVWKFQPHRPMLSLLSVIWNYLFFYFPLLSLLESRWRALNSAWNTLKGSNTSGSGLLHMLSLLPRKLFALMPL